MNTLNNNDTKIQQLLEKYETLKYDLESLLLNYKDYRRFKNNTMFYFFILKHNAFNFESNNINIDEFFDYAPIELIISQLQDETFRSSIPQLLSRLCGRWYAQLDDCEDSECEWITQFFAVRAAITFYHLLKYSNTSPPSNEPPNFSDVCKIQDLLPPACRFLLQDYLTYVAKVYPDGNHSELLKKLCITNECRGARFLTHLYNIVPWYKDRVNIREVIIDIMTMSLPLVAQLELLEQKKLKIESFFKYKSFTLNWNIYHDFMYKTSLDERNADLIIKMFQLFTNNIRYAIISMLDSSKIKKILLSAFRIKELSVIEEVKINWVIRNMNISGDQLYKPIEDQYEFTPCPERIPISASEPVLPEFCSFPMHTMPPLFGSSIVPDDIILSLNKSLNSQYHLISNILLFILMPYNKSFRADMAFVVRRYTRELLAIEHTKPISYRYETRSNKRKLDEISKDIYIINGRRSKKMEFKNKNISTVNYGPFLPDNYICSLSQANFHLPHCPWKINEYSNEHGYLAQ